MANKRAFQDEVKDKNRRARKDQRKKKKKTQGSFWNSIATIFGSKIFRGLLTFVLAMVIGGVGTYLYLNSRPSQQTVLASMKGKEITVADLYARQKGNQATKEALLETILSDILEDKYGKKVSQDEVDKQYNDSAKKAGSNFSSMLEQYGYTQDSYKNLIRLQLLQNYALKATAKKDLTEKKLKSLYKDYNPDVTISYVKTDDESKANSIHDQATADGADFSQIVKDNNGQENVSFDSGDKYDSDKSSNLPPEDVQKAAFKLDKDGVSDTIKVQGSDNSTSYYVIKVTAKTEKNPDWKNYKKRLTTIYVNQKTSDSSFKTQVIASLLKEYNVTVKDKTYSSLFSQYGLNGNSTSSSSKSK
ncbi:peptidyl-prolyl cis-trans isomerase [Streptococcus sobrinus]|uniref:Foldase protein PrsA n=4 Tax=Streptococcus sobrinus TaxID=1310 RepID=U2KGY6_9STRE|nr:peptidyl-prolyl cis-trans isomerase [Streptococcus sobrinus]RKV76860.1 MAG: foldase [Streptococcus sp.]AWN21202.1 foldase [Streptococcus sobrinus]EMP72620.1 Foldase protein PrsA 1 [Streptococcus sobrinus DSM 20742 = ATCC 33478]ERJ74083.1 putative foldase protein PrsA [Streptococcus sobrinus W1703]OZV23172.1 foldase [Streptococcus sobrinus]